MQAFGQIVDPNLTYDGLKDLTRKLKRPAGGKLKSNVPFHVIGEFPRHVAEGGEHEHAAQVSIRKSDSDG